MNIPGLDTKRQFFFIKFDLFRFIHRIVTHCLIPVKENKWKSKKIYRNRYINVGIGVQINITEI